MFDGDFDHREQQRMPLGRIRECACDRSVQFLTQTLVIRIDFFALRPVRRLIRRQSSAHGINPKREQLVECLVERLQSKRSLREQIPVERFNVSNIKNDAVSFRDRAVVHGLFAHDFKQVVGALAGFSQSEVQIVAYADGAVEGSHAIVLRYVWMPRSPQRCSEMLTLAGMQGATKFTPFLRRCQSKRWRNSYPECDTNETYHPVSRRDIQRNP